MADTREVLMQLALCYPKHMIDGQVSDVDRIAFLINLVVKHKGTKISIVDIGGGVGLFSVGCAALGMESILVDDFQDEVNRVEGDSVLQLHRKHGVRIIATDFVENPPDLEPNSLDVVASFGSLEHWHNSPERSLRLLMTALKPDGLFVLGTPNCVNLRKRITALLGYGKWSRMRDWYEKEKFRGHVREPDVDDLLYIGKDLGLKEMHILGRCLMYYHDKRTAVRTISRIADRLLRPFPSLCSNIYLIGKGRNGHGKQPDHVSSTAGNCSP